MSDMYSSQASSSAHLPAGTKLNGIYEIERHIASGGMGQIYRGHAIETGDAVAIKVMRTDLADNAMALALFRKEASALHYIHHDAIVRYYVFSLDPDTHRHYLAMEFVDGEPLSEILKKGPLPFDKVCLLQERLAAGLEAAHRHGIIHRDLSPDNILIPAGDVSLAKIIDFGIARSTRANDGTVIGSGFAGKFNYVSPEQLGLWDGNVTAKSDIYSLGLVLAECLSGKALDMGGSQLEVIEKRRVVPDLSHLDARFRPLIDRMLQSDPKDRPESMAVVAAWRPGGKAQNGSSAGFVPSLLGRTGELAAAASAPRRRLALGVLAALVVLIGGTGAYFLVGQLAAPSVGTTVLPPNLNPDAGIDARQAEDARRAMAEAQERQRREQQDAARQNEQAKQVARTEPRPNAKALEGGLSAPDRPPSDFRERIRRFVSAYDGGDCFFVEPVLIAEQKTTLEGYGSSAAPFEVLDYEFKRTNGFEATVGYHAVSARQCAAIGFLSRLRSPGGQRLRLDLSAGNLQSDGYISGSVSGFDNSRIELLMVDHVGMVQSLTELLKGAGDIKTFIVNLRREDSGPPRLQLVLAVASNAALDALKPARPGSPEIGPADRVFAKVLDEAQRSRQTLNAGVKSFNFEK